MTPLNLFSITLCLLNTLLSNNKVFIICKNHLISVTFYCHKTKKQIIYHYYIHTYIYIEKNILSIEKIIVSLHSENDGVLAHLARAFDWQSKGNRFDSDILHKEAKASFLIYFGVLAHLVERLVRNQKVVGSSPIYSTQSHPNNTVTHSPHHIYFFLRTFAKNIHL